MFIKSRYIFETKNTRFRRHCTNIVLFLVGFFVLYSIVCLVFVDVSYDESRKSEAALFNRSPDLIVVFTGAKGRIPLAVEIARKYRQPRIFITGVFSKNSINTILGPSEFTKDIDRDFLTIDYLARNTFENALATYRYVQNNQGISKILIISHDYHIMRIKKLMEEIPMESNIYEFYYMGVETDYTSLKNVVTLYKEVFKLARTYIFLWIWNRETDIISASHSGDNVW